MIGGIYGDNEKRENLGRDGKGQGQNQRPADHQLEQKHKEAENEEIVDIVRGMSIPLDELPLLLQKLRGTSGQAGQKSVPVETGVAEGESPVCWRTCCAPS